LRASARKSSKSGTFQAGKIIPQTRHGAATTGTWWCRTPFQHQDEKREFVMYIGLGGLLVLILILWLLGVI
jgi:hypothetical protein